MNQHHYILGLGSNWNSERNIAYAIEKLNTIFDTIKISTPIKTTPIGMPNDYMFLNCVAMLSSEMPADELKVLLKEMETECGRNGNDKKKGIISLDIDIIKADETILKEEDFKRDYIIQSVKELENRQ